ncbi:DUF1353 domain-containing protein [Rathayibacter sp. YIM 133350]|uniref:DUF1353 domain-containing protein n=1 Tax=Rathayibacter sp. YIM 133350 TaxID=3131992 RepID=UPI00307DF3E5
MPFYTADGRGLTSIELAQVPPDGDRFQLRSAIVYLDAVTGARLEAPAHVPQEHPSREESTDLASVPQFLWSFIASYGRQSAAAIVHDARSVRARGLGDDAAALVQRRQDDASFRRGLREQGVPLLRSWLMWSWVAAERYLSHARPLGILLVAQVVLSVVVVAASVVLAFGSPWWLLLVLLPALVALPWGRDAGLAALLSYGSAFVAPLLLLHLLSLAPFRLVEFVVELAVGGRPASVLRPTLTRR